MKLKCIKQKQLTKKLFPQNLLTLENHFEIKMYLKKQKLSFHKLYRENLMRHQEIKKNKL